MRFRGPVGYSEGTQENLSSPGVFEEVIVERIYRGDVTRDSRRLIDGDKINNDLTVNNAISVVADDYAVAHHHKIRYVELHGVRWTVTTVEMKPPRLVMTMGEVYNGPTPSPS